MDGMGHMLREVWDCMNIELNMNTLSGLTWIFLNNCLCQVAGPSMTISASQALRLLLNI